MRLSYNFCFSYVFLRDPKLLKTSASKVISSRIFLSYSRNIKHFIANRLANLFSEASLQESLFRVLPSLKKFIDPTIFFSKLSHLYFNSFNKLQNKHLAMQQMPCLMEDVPAQSTAFFEIFIRNLKSVDTNTAYNSAINISKILDDYDIPSEKYGPLLMQQVVDLLINSQERAMPQEHLLELKRICGKLIKVLQLYYLKRFTFERVSV